MSPTEGVAAEVHLFSDGRFSDVADFAAGNLDLNYHRIGAADDSDNVGIVAFNAVAQRQGPGNLHVFLRVLNFRARTGANPRASSTKWTGRTANCKSSIPTFKPLKEPLEGR